MAVYSAYCLPAHRMPGKGVPIARWIEEAIFYQIYPQSFQDTNGDGIGDIQGIISRLDYIHSLGCNTIWLNPCFHSAFMDAGYDVIDFYRVAPRYGTNDDLRRLFDEAHQRGMRVVLDLVAGHSSDQSPWFKYSQNESGTPIPTAIFGQMTPRYVLTDSLRETLNATEVIARITLSASLP